MSELKYIASKNGLKYKIVRFEAGSEGKRASQNNNKSRVYEENQAKFLKNAEGRLSYLLELKEKLSSKTTQEEPPSRDNND